MRHLSASVLLLLASTLAPCQKRIFSFDPNSVNFDPKLLCPLSLFALRQSAPHIQNTGDDNNQSPSQQLHVSLKSKGGGGVLSIDATLHALPPYLTLLPVDAGHGDLTKTFQIQPKAGQNGITSFEVSMQQAGSLRWVDITLILYADGTSWHASGTSECRAVPSNFVL